MTTPQPLAQEVAVARRADGAEDGHAAARRRREHDGEVFGRGGGERSPTQLGVPLLGTVPLDPRLREARRRGRAARLADPDAEGRGDRRASPRHAAASAAARRLQDARCRSSPERCAVDAAALRSASTRTRRDAGRSLPRRGGAGQGGPRALAGRLARDAATTSTRRRGRERSSPSRATSAGTATARSATSTLDAIVRRAARRPARRARASSSRRDVPDRHARLLGAPARRRRPRRRADRDVAAAARSPGRRAEARGHEPARDRDSELRRAPGRRRRVDGQGHLRRRARRPARTERPRPVRRRAARTRRSRSRSACSCSSTRSPGEDYGAVLLVARPEADPVPAFRALARRRTTARRLIGRGVANRPATWQSGPFVRRTAGEPTRLPAREGDHVKTSTRLRALLVAVSVTSLLAFTASAGARTTPRTTDEGEAIDAATASDFTAAQFPDFAGRQSLLRRSPAARRARTRSRRRVRVSTPRWGTAATRASTPTSI